MQITGNAKITEHYLPTRRCRIMRERVTQKEISVWIREIERDDFPLAMIVETPGYISKGTGEPVFGTKRTELRVFDGQLYKAVERTDTISETKLVNWRIFGYPCSNSENIRYPHTEKSVPIDNNLASVRQQCQKQADRFLISGGSFWSRCEEPMYVINTFGLGCNHGGTGMFIEDTYNPNLSRKRYFNALQRNEAIAYANALASKRGDTNDIGKFGIGCNILVLLPEYVRRDPQKEE